MPTMIPDVLSLPAKPCEQAIFERLRGIPLTGGRYWKVFHSELVEDSEKFGGPCGIDFVILIPAPYYTVICLEVKDGSFEIDKYNQWRRIDNYPYQLVNPSPIQQAQKAMTVLKRSVPSYFGPLKLGSAVAVCGTFRSAVKLPAGTLVIDQKDIDSVSNSLVEKLENYARVISGESRSPKPPCEYEASHKALEALGEYLQNELESTDMSEKRDIIRYNLDTYRQEFLRLTADQLAILNQVKLNPRCVIKGAAGTGKTILAMERAKELASANEHGEKKKVALLCSNSYLSRRLEEWAETLDGVVAGTPFSLPLTLLKEDPFLRKNHLDNIRSKYSELKESLRPEYQAAGWGPFIRDVVDLLNEQGYFDYLIVDEAQNLYDEVFLGLMEALLKGGLTNGEWMLFGDFDYQNIVDLEFDGDGMKELEKALKGQGVEYYSKFELEINCRSTQEIAEAFSIFLDDDDKPLPPPMNGVHGPDLEIKYFQSTQEVPEEGEELPKLEDLLDSLVSDFNDRGFSSEQMVLLRDRNELGIDTQRTYGGYELLDIHQLEESLKETERVAIHQPEEPLKDSEGVVNPSSSPCNRLRYCEVYDFQGLESELVFLVLSVTDEMMVAGGSVVIPHEKYMERLLYTGMSRAKTMLVIVADKGYEELIRESMSLYGK